MVAKINQVKEVIIKNVEEKGLRAHLYTATISEWIVSPSLVMKKIKKSLGYIDNAFVVVTRSEPPLIPIYAQKTDARRITLQDQLARMVEKEKKKQLNEKRAEVMQSYRSMEIDSERGACAITSIHS